MSKIKKLTMNTIAALSLFGVADAAFAVERRNTDINNNRLPPFMALTQQARGWGGPGGHFGDNRVFYLPDPVQEVPNVITWPGSEVIMRDAQNLFEAVDASSFGEGDHNIETNNNRWPAKEAFRIVAQKVNELRQRRQNITPAMRTEVNVRFFAFLCEWYPSSFSEDVVSADDFMRLVTHPVLDLMSVENHRGIFHHVACDKGRADILRHCLGAGEFHSFVLEQEGQSTANFLNLLYCNALEAFDVAQENGGMATQRAEERAISALFLAETELEIEFVVENGSHVFFNSQVHYIATGQLVRPPQNREDINVVETMWQNADPQQMLGNLERLRTLGLKLPNSVALRLFRSFRTYDVVHRLIVDYIENRQTILSEEFLQELEDFERQYRGGTIDQRNLYVRLDGPRILNNAMGQRFLEFRLEQDQEDSSEDNQESTLDL